MSCMGVHTYILTYYFKGLETKNQLIKLLKAARQKICITNRVTKTRIAGYFLKTI